MKRYTIALIVAVLLWFGTYIGAYLGQIGVPEQSHLWLKETYEIKDNYALADDQPKIMIVAGSGAMFSISAEMIEAETGVKTVNYGTHAGLTLKYHLWRSKTIINPGDMVLLPIEYPLYHYNGDVLPETLSKYVSYYDPDYFIEEMSLDQKANILFSLNIFHLLKRNVDRFRTVEITPGYYDATYLNKWGDKTNTFLDDRGEYEFTQLAKARPGGVPYNPQREAWTILDEYITEMQAMDVTVVHLPQVAMDFESYLTDEGNLRRFGLIFAFFEERGAGSPLTYDQLMFSHELFYNSREHISHEGRIQSTQVILEGLAPLIDEWKASK